jgi:hypothetical protein
VPDADFSGWFALFGTHPCLRIASSAETLAGCLLFSRLTESNPAAGTSLAANYIAITGPFEDMFNFNGLRNFRIEKIPIFGRFFRRILKKT